VIGSFPISVREELFQEMQSLVTTLRPPVVTGRPHEQASAPRAKNEVSRWNNGKDLSFIRCGRSGSSRSATTT